MPGGARLGQKEAGSLASSLARELDARADAREHALHVGTQRCDDTDDDRGDQGGNQRVFDGTDAAPIATEINEMTAHGTKKIHRRPLRYLSNSSEFIRPERH